MALKLYRVAAFLGGALAFVLVFYAIPRALSETNPAPSPLSVDAASKVLPVVASAVSPQPKFGLPLRLKIPAINVDAPIEHLGLTPDGAMEAPQTPDQVAWYKLGPRPGEAGSAVIAGHSGQWANGAHSVFDNLHKLRPGDTVLVEDKVGLTTRFIVRESRNYKPEADATAVFGSKDGKVHLNLITCEGVWDKTSKSYSQRLIVFADKG